MSEQEKLPVCALCGRSPVHPEHGIPIVMCVSESCRLRFVQMSTDDWRRLMARPRLAPEHVEALRYAARLLEIEWYKGVAKTIRAALAALGEA